MWLKALHIIFMVTWFAGLFYLPRLFVYHAMSNDTISIERFKIMERKLYFGIMTPSLLVMLLFSFWMLWDYAWAAYSHMGWLHVKLLLVGMLVIYHLWCGKLLKTFKHDQNKRSHVWYRWFNEAPVLLLVAIVILASVKPF